MIASRVPEKCYYCDSKAEYNQLVGATPEEFTVSGVCKKHLIIDIS